MTHPSIKKAIAWAEKNEKYVYSACGAEATEELREWVVALRLLDKQIAAAPDLLEALQEVVRVFDDNPSSIADTVWVTGGSPETLYDHCRAAIAKAGGAA